MKAKTVQKADIVPYTLGDSSPLSVRVDGETVWLTQGQMAALFGCDRVNITQHLGNIFESGELDEEATCKDFLLVQNEGGRQVSRTVAHYNLDAVISVGFRVNSKRGIAFRQWANKVIRERMLAALEAKKPAAIEAKTGCQLRNVARKPLTRSRSSATCRKCLFGRLVETSDGELKVECHVSRPTSAGVFPLVRPDDFCSNHVAVKSRRREFAGLVPESANVFVSPAIAANN